MVLRRVFHTANYHETNPSGVRYALRGVSLWWMDITHGSGRTQPARPHVSFKDSKRSRRWDLNHKPIHDLTTRLNTTQWIAPAVAYYKSPIVIFNVVRGLGALTKPPGAAAAQRARSSVQCRCAVSTTRCAVRLHSVYEALYSAAAQWVQILLRCGCTVCTEPCAVPLHSEYEALCNGTALCVRSLVQCRRTVSTKPCAVPLHGECEALFSAAALCVRSLVQLGCTVCTEPCTVGLHSVYGAPARIAWSAPVRGNPDEASCGGTRSRRDDCRRWCFLPVHGLQGVPRDLNHRC
jgi:hypothetical protein